MSNPYKNIARRSRISDEDKAAVLIILALPFLVSAYASLWSYAWRIIP